MAGYTEQHLIDALISSMVDNSSYAVLAGEDMPMVMRQEMESSMSRLAEPIHDHIVSWATNSGSGGPPYEYNLGNPPFDGYILASTSDGVRYWTPPGTGGVVNETDPVFLASVAYGITSTQITNWDTAYGWGDHSSIGYELGLGNPTVDGYVLASTTAGIRSWVSLPTGGGMVYPSAGIALSTGSSWGTSITDNSSNWNTAYGWGDHSGLYRPVAWVPTWDDVTNKPTAFTPINHGLVSSYHTVSGLTTGHFLRASSSTTYGFAALLDTDIKPLLNDWFELVGTAPNQYIRCKYPFAGDYDIQGYTDFDQFPPTIWESMPLATTLAIGGIQLNGSTTQYLRGDGTWATPPSGSGMVYPAGSGIPIVVSGTSWGTTITNNSTNWNTAYGWGNHAGLYSLVSHTHTGMVDYTGTPVNNQVAVFTDTNTIEGHTGFTYDSTTGYVNVAGIVRASGSLQHLTLQAGNASGAAGTDAGNITIKAGDAINADSASVAGAIYLVPGNLYTSIGSGIIYLGNSTSNVTRVSFRSTGSQANVGIEFIPKGDGSVILGGYTTYIMGALSMGESIQINEGYRLLTPEILGRNGTGPLTIRAPGGYSGSPDGRDLRLYPGLAYTGGVNGNIYLGTGSAGYLPEKVSETDIIYYDSTTGKISYGAAPTSGTNYWQRSGTLLSPATAGDDLEIDGDVWLNAAVYITSQFLDTPLGYMLENNNSNRLAIGTGLNFMVITYANRHKVPGVAASTHPTLSVWSNADPEINANQYIAMTHNGTEGVIWSATGLVKIDDGLIVTGALTLSGLSSTATAYVLYYNSTTGAITYGDVPSGGSGITGTGLTGRIAYWTGASTVSYGSLYWNNANNSVGIGISPSSANLHVSGDDGVTIQSAAATGSQIRIINTSTTGDASILFYSNTSTAVGSVGWDYNTSSYFKINYGAITNTHITISSSGYVGIGGVPESLYALAVRGHMYMADTTILNTAPSTTTSSGFRIRHGTAPSSPTNGDVWTTTSGMYVRINGTTVGPLGTGGSGVTPVDSTLLDWSTDRYQPYAAAAAGAFDSGAVNPSGTTRLNYGGYLYATRLYSGGEQTITLSAAVNANRLAVYSGPTSVSSLATLYMVGDVLNAGYLFLGASNTTYASIRLPHGTAPTSPTNGDMWTTTSGIYVRINGTTVGPLGAGGGITGSGSSGRVTYWSGTSAVTSSANLTFDGSILTISNGIRLTAPATNQTGSGIRSSFTAGEALVFGNLVYMKSDGKVWKAAASSITTTPVMGMCMGTVSAEGSADILLSGRVYNSSWSLGTGGNVLYLGTSAGGFSSVAPSGVTGYVVQVIGVVLSATTIYLNPSLNRITLA